MEFDFRLGGDISFSADMGYRPAPAADIRPADARIIGDLAGAPIIGDAEPLEV